jgi:hypothetical protein
MYMYMDGNRYTITGSEGYAPLSPPPSQGSPAIGVKNCPPNTIPIDIIFSHKARIKCIVKQVKKKFPTTRNEKASACEPDNGGIVIIVDSGKGENKTLSVFYHPSQFKSKGGSSTDASCGGGGNCSQRAADQSPILTDCLREFFENTEDDEQAFKDNINKIYIFVRHGWGWHNNEDNKSTKTNWYYSSSKTPGQGWDADLFDDNIAANQDTGDQQLIGNKPNGFQDAVNAGKTLGVILESISKYIKPCIEALFCSDLQRTAETGNIALAAAKNISPVLQFPSKFIILPCNHELPSGTCEGIKVSTFSGFSPSYENETSLPAQGTGIWGTTFGDKPSLGLEYESSKYRKFYSGVRKTGMRSGTRTRGKCHDFVFPENIEWTLDSMNLTPAQWLKRASTTPQQQTAEAAPAPAAEAAPAAATVSENSRTDDSDQEAADDNDKASPPKKKNWWNPLTKGGRRKRKTMQKRKRRTKRKQKRRRVRVTLCKKKVFHKCKTRKHRKRRS